MSMTYNAGTPHAHTAVSDVTFSIRKGEIVSVVGPSGAGKTTLLRCLSGLQPVTSGSVTFRDKPLVGVPEGLSVVFQEYGRSLFPWLSVAKNVQLPLKVAGVGAKERQQRAEEALERVGLSEHGRKYPWQLSGGMQQRVAIGRALVSHPSLLLMDEPFASVDAQTRASLEDLTLHLRAQLGFTVVVVTHDIDEAVYMSDRVVVVNGKPSTVSNVIDIPLDRPRNQITTRSHEAFGRLRSDLFIEISGPSQ
jgi:NitT/TauT family transport system ATP-binding protein